MPHRATYLFPRQFSDSIEALSTNASVATSLNADAKLDCSQSLTFLHRSHSPHRQGLVQEQNYETDAVKSYKSDAVEGDWHLQKLASANCIDCEFWYDESSIQAGDADKVKKCASPSWKKETRIHKLKKRHLHDEAIYYDRIPRTGWNNSVCLDYNDVNESLIPGGHLEAEKTASCERDGTIQVPLNNISDIEKRLVLFRSSASSHNACCIDRKEDDEVKANTASHGGFYGNLSLQNKEEGEKDGGFQMLSSEIPSKVFSRKTAVGNESKDENHGEPPHGVSEIGSLEGESSTVEDETTRGMDAKKRQINCTMENYHLLLGMTKGQPYQSNFDVDGRRSPTGGSATNLDTLSYQFWLNGCLSYSDKISDGFYNILGMNPYLWMLAIDDENTMGMPSLGSLKEIREAPSSIEVVVLDKSKDTILNELEETALELKSVLQDRMVLVEKLGKLVGFCMGGSFSIEHGDLYSRWRTESRRLRDSCKCIVLPIGSLRVGLCRHRAILFKKLADCVGLPCRIARGCKYCASYHCSSCFVKIEDEQSFPREVLVDLVGKPGFLYGSDWTVNAISSVATPFQNSNLKEYRESNAGGPPDSVAMENKHRYFIRQPFSGFGCIHLEPSLSMDLLEIPWNELRIKEFVGSGSFGVVHRADWHGSDVAVKILNIDGVQGGQVAGFLREVSIMKRVRHPNLVLFMGAVINPSCLAIVSEFMHRGSLYRLIHNPAAGEKLDKRKRLRVALDVAKGINYLHCLSPPIVHGDIKSPNLLVDKNWTVKVCDFGLSRYKANTPPMSKSIAGTPEWMAPEFLRGEPSNEKSDVYGFGVILWELATMQKPWSGLSSSQVVGAVAYQKRRPLIPQHVSPALAELIKSCWADDPLARPSFQTIVDSLKKLLKSPLQQQQAEDQKQ